MRVAFEVVQRWDIVALEVGCQCFWELDFAEVCACLRDAGLAVVVVVLASDTRVEGTMDSALGITDTLVALLLFDEVEDTGVVVLPYLLAV